VLQTTRSLRGEHSLDLLRLHKNCNIVAHAVACGEISLKKVRQNSNISHEDFSIKKFH
jgi:hypothetical protein